MKTNRNTIGLVVAGAFLVSPICGALAKPITYTFTAEGDITGTLGSVAIGGPGETLTFTALGDTSNALSFDLGAGLPHGWTNPATTASITVTNNSNGAVVAEGTFSSADGIFLSIDNVNGGVGFGSGFPSFPGAPVYPFGLRPDTSAEPGVLSYDLQSDVTFTAPAGMGGSFIGGLSCLGFPGACVAPTALATTGGDLILGAAGAQFAVTDAGTFDAKTMSTPEPSTWAMMLFGFAGLGLIGYRQTRKRQAATA
jgi:hypothetical protein